MGLHTYTYLCLLTYLYFIYDAADAELEPANVYLLLRQFYYCPASSSSLQPFSLGCNHFSEGIPLVKVLWENANKQME